MSKTSNKQKLTSLKEWLTANKIKQRPKKDEE
jgi:hypothetical protein